MAQTPTNQGFDFSEEGDLVPGTASKINPARIKTDRPGSEHTYPHAGGTRDFYIPQSRIRQFTKFEQAAPDNGTDLSFSYGAGCTVGGCEDDHRYWPAYRTNLQNSSRINKFVINELQSHVKCKRWASRVVDRDNALVNEKQSSDEGIFGAEDQGEASPEMTKRNIGNESAMFDSASPGFLMTDSTLAGSKIDHPEWENNYVNSFLDVFAPGYTSDCCARASVSFKGMDPARGRFDLDKYGHFFHSQRRADRQNLIYGTNYYDNYGAGRRNRPPAQPNEDCANHQTCGDIFYKNSWVNERRFMNGGITSSAERSPPNSNDIHAGKKWKNPNLSTHWVEPDVCWNGAHAELPLSITGGFHLATDRSNPNFHCLRCFNGYEWDNTEREIVLDTSQKCNAQCIDIGDSFANGGMVGDDTYFIHEGIFYDKSTWLEPAP